MNKIQVGTIVVNMLKKEDVGSYVEQYDVRVLPEMLTENCGKTYAEVMYIDDDGAVITREFGPYAYPANKLRVATEEEKLAYDTERYTVIIPFRGENYTLPLDLSKVLINDYGVTFGEDNVENDEQLIKYLHSNWNKLDVDKQTRLVLLKECIRVYKQRANSNRSSYHFNNLAYQVVHGKDKEALALFCDMLYKNPVKDKELYIYLESNDHYIIPKEYAEIIREKNGYLGGALVEGLDLYEYLKENRYYNGNFQHYDKLKVSKEGLDLLMDYCWGSSETKRLIERLNMNMEMIRHFLMNPKRNFSVDMNIWFKSLDWNEIMDNKDMFANSLKSAWDLMYRVKRGNYVAPEYAIHIFNNSSAATELMYSKGNTNKDSLKLKDMISYLETITSKDMKSLEPGSIRIEDANPIRFEEMTLSTEFPF